jgi:hypothetical protein
LYCSTSSGERAMLESCATLTTVSELMFMTHSF